MLRRFFKIDGNYHALIYCLAYVGLVRVYITFNPAQFRSIQQAKVFDWPVIGLWIILGVIGVFFGTKSRLILDQPKTSDVRKISVTAGIGFSLGFLSVANDLVTQWTDYVERQLSIPSIHIAFPQSMVLYPAGAIVHEIFNRLFLISFLFWLATLILKGKYKNLVFAVIALLTSLIEPWGDLRLPLGLVAVSTTFLLDFSLNMAQAYIFHSYGFVYTVLTRVFFYLVWHVAYQTF